MKKPASLILCILMIFSFSVCVFAENEVKLTYKEDYNGDNGTVTVTVYINNAPGIQSGVVSLFFDPDGFTFSDNGFNQTASSNILSEGGKTVDNNNECCCAFMSTAEISSSDCTNGTLELCTFKFKVTGSYKQGSFFLRGSDFYKNDSEITVTPYGSNTSNTTAVKTTKKTGKEPQKNKAEIENELNGLNDIENNNNNNSADTVGTAENISTAESISTSTASENKKSQSNTVLIIVIIVLIITAAAVAVIISKKRADKKNTKVAKPVIPEDKPDK